MIKNICPKCNNKFWFIKSESIILNPDKKWNKYSKVKRTEFCPLCNEELIETNLSKNLEILWRITLVLWIMTTAFDIIQKGTLTYWVTLIFVLLITLFPYSINKYKIKDKIKDNVILK
ncbi:hypothetical protein MNBD_GAMMA09-885 [hydrothermal vent metagenome]|uniref:Uncharacterized protein n=1 Tax=hydrothermal vent metagenome TaxID=652676 RepID=A0A3B0Y8Z9_9ZZZZ